MSDAETSDGRVTAPDLDIREIMELIPHRYPFLLVDRLTEIEKGERAVGIKNVSINEPYFAGHFPRRPVMPGVLIIESMAQTAGCLVVVSLEAKSEDKLVYFMTVDNARFRRPVVPGDQMRVQVERIHHRGPVWKFAGKAWVDGKLVAEAVFSAMLADR